MFTYTKESTDGTMQIAWLNGEAFASVGKISQSNWRGNLLIDASIILTRSSRKELIEALLEEYNRICKTAPIKAEKANKVDNVTVQIHSVTVSADINLKEFDLVVVDIMATEKANTLVWKGHRLSKDKFGIEVIEQVYDSMSCIGFRAYVSTDQLEEAEEAVTDAVRKKINEIIQGFKDMEELANGKPKIKRHNYNDYLGGII